MDRAQFEFIGNVGKIEIKPTKNKKKIATISIATSERWKRDNGEWTEKTYWHRITIFAPAKIALIETAAQVGTRLRLVGQVRPTSWEDDRGHTRYAIEFVVGPFGEVEILARGKPKGKADSSPSDQDAA